MSSSESQTPVWFITAASSGFGKFIALEALSRGHKVIASARSETKIQDLKDRGADIVALDVTWPLDRISQVAQEVNAKYGYVNHLVNAAGYLLFGAVEETSPKEDFDSFNTNVLGMLNVSKAFLPYLRATAATSAHCTVANFGSIASWNGGPGYALYNGAKWACSGISEGMRLELSPLGIAVTIVEPGYFRTGFLNSGAFVQCEKRLDAYAEGPVGAVRKALGETNNNQRGDVVKGCKVLVDILTKTGLAEGKEVPVRVALGSDSPPSIRDKIKQTEELLKEWDPITTNTDHE